MLMNVSHGTHSSQVLKYAMCLSISVVCYIKQNLDRPHVSCAQK
jgi:hypothetical protein